MPVSVDYATIDNTALAGSDYVANSGTLIFNPGEISKTITVQVIGDIIVEPNENFLIKITNPVNAILGSITQVQGIIFNDDNPPLPSISISGSLITEGNAGFTNANFGVTLSAPSTSTVTVNFSTADGNANAGSDYVSKSGTVTFAPGVTTQNITIQVIGDINYEPNENFFVNLSGATNAIISIAQGQGSIINDDQMPSLSINDVSIVEGNTGMKLLNFTINLSSPSGFITSVDYATINGTAVGNATPGLGDFTMRNDHVVLNPGVTSLIVDVPINGDVDFETDEQFFVDLNNSVNASISKGRGVGTITNDDFPNLSINDVSLAEGNSGTSLMNFTVTLSQPSPLTVTVDFSTINGTASAASDYYSNTGTLIFSPGEVSKTISVTINGDTTVEPDEIFTVNLAGAINAKFSDPIGEGKIINDELPSISISDITVTR